MRASLSVRLAPVLFVLLLAGSGVLDRTGNAQGQSQQTLTAPDTFFGFRMGADRKLANWEKLHEYYQLLARNTNRMKLVELGKSSEGRPFIALFISSPANLAKLDQYRQINARLNDPRGITEPEVRKLVADGRAVVIQSFGLHSSEVAATQTAAEFVHDSLSRTDEEAARVLDNVVSIVLPSINPDGSQMIADWYMKYVGTEHEAAGLPRLYQKYAGHDNNRDAFQTNLAESQHIAKLMFREWIPQAYVDHHQMGSGNARLYIPPYAEPVRPSADPLVWREIGWWGAHMGYKLEEGGKTGVISDAIYSGWGHMGFHWITPFHNIAGMLTESASARLATPLFMHPDQLRGGPRNLPAYEEQTNMPSLWPGGWWRVRDIVEQQKIAAWATVDIAARNRETVLWNAHQKAKRQTERGAAATTKAYLVPAAQHDGLTARKMINKLLDQGVEIQQAKSEFVVEGKVYGAGSFVISMAQPKMGVVRWMLGRTFYPDNTYTRERDASPIRPYDMATDTMTEFMGARSDAVGIAVTTGNLAKLNAHVPMGGTVTAGAAGFVLDTRLNDSFRAVNLLLERGVAVRRVPRLERHSDGDFIVTGTTAAVVADVAKQTGVDFTGLEGAVPPGTYEIRKPRIAMYQRYGGGNMDEGWTRLMLEQFGFPYKSLMDAEIKSGALETKYDAIILPSDSINAMTGEPQAGGPGSGRGGGPSNTPPEYRSGFGAEGVKALQAFVQKGGTLVTFAQSGDLPIQRFGLPLRNVVAGLPSKEFWCPGSTLRVKFDNLNPLAYGMPSEGLATFLAGSQVYEIGGTDKGEEIEILATYVDRDILQSGWLLGEAIIARKAAAVAVKHGAGKVVLLGFRPQHRAQTHGTFKLVFNALVNGPVGARPATSNSSQR
jgi:hypothetical protein